MRDEDFERLYDEHAQALYGFLAYRTGDPVLAEDLLADTFEKALRARRRFDRRRGSEKTWLYSIALNALRDQLRRRSAAERATEQLAIRTPGEVAAVEESLGRRDELAQALARLSEEEREVVALRYGADLTVPEIARLKKEKLTTIEGRVYRALRKLREQLD
ncbi:MAG TPA: RNA polymerase sigma factor [Thermoleophilaceae bacterium]